MNNITLLRMKHTAKLERLIKDNASYDEILKQSQILDKYIMAEIKSNPKFSIKKETNRPKC